MDLFSRLRGAVNCMWGMDRAKCNLIYKMVFVPKIAYAANFWGHTAELTKAREALGSIQRRALLGMTAAYNTASTQALQVIAGILPLDLQVAYTAFYIDSKPEQNNKQLCDDMWLEVINKWQVRWTSSSKGRWTHKFFPDVKSRIATPIWLNHRLVQFLTGHGNFRERLFSFNLVPSPICSCGQENESVEHVLYRCSRLSITRARLVMAVERAGHVWPCDPSTFVSSKYSAFDRFAQEAFD